jgi:flagellar biogenesis protein FliO
MDFLFGEEHYGLSILLAFFVVVALIGVFGWLVRRIRSKRIEAGRTRVRQPRLAVIDAAILDARRRLVLIRRDNAEHLLMIGGPTDIVVEPNIVRASAREPALARPPAFAEATQHPVATQNEGTWPPQQEPAAAVSARPRPQRQSPMAEEPVPPQTEAEPPATPRQPRPVDRLAVLATEVSDQSARGTAQRVSRDREALRVPQPTGAAPPQNTPAESVFTPAVEHNFAETTQRLVEAALHRHRKPRPGAELKAPRSGIDTSPETQSESQPEADAERESVLTTRAAGEARLAHDEAKLSREGQTPPPRPSSVYGSLEQNMANLLGGPTRADENDYPLRYTRRTR